MLKIIVGLLISLGLLVFFFQNCSQAEFSPSESIAADEIVDDFDKDPVVPDPDPEDPVIICNPLTGENCDVSSSDGLIGSLFYMTHDPHSALFEDGNLNNARLDKYPAHGNKLEQLIKMDKIDVPQKNWESGFSPEDGEPIKDNQGNRLNEYFYLDLKGYIMLPEGSYEFATISDDGMRVTIDEKVYTHLDDEIKATIKCSDHNGERQTLTFGSNNKKNIRVEYFQGPRTGIAMQFFYRQAGSGQECDERENEINYNDDIDNVVENQNLNTIKIENGNWQIVPAEAFSHDVNY